MVAPPVPHADPRLDGLPLPPQPVDRTPRIAPGGRRELGLPGWAFARIAGRALGTDAPAIFRTLGRHRSLFRGWLWFAGRLMPGGLLARRETELVILRVAHLRASRYEFEHHVRLGRRAGIDAEGVRRVVAGPDAPGWTSRERALLAAADRLVADRDLDDDAWRALRAELDDREAIELCMLVGHYDMLATVLGTLRVQTDVPRARG
ncbi:carboxymuconolactone decarboxylase family protein [Patulibacter brassicae]|uniref:Carboxymuconolactone decarboxylase family protein n=1 Tax=Patulibacter brassicae TaxID=1705717 RepID=A0ABU4VF12_9ACTN|nr:carboxymuconolactone decarboxylase family protein [Patulibacter brassicae]MDX8150385.1 carboxymuconolactone decarboxylase family protein [Patulibacter brassicae]